MPPNPALRHRPSHPDCNRGLPWRRVRMNAIQAAAVTLATIVYYVASVGAVPTIDGHIEDGRLQWMRSRSTVSAILQFYELPARRLAVLPGVRWVFELS